MKKLHKNKNNYQYLGIFKKRIRIKNENLWGVKDHSGKIILEHKFNEIFSLSSGYDILAARIGKNWNLFDNKGNKISSENYNSIHSYYGMFGISKVKKGNNWGIIDKFGKQIIPIIYKSINIFGKGIVLKKDDNSVEYIEREILAKITLDNYKEDKNTEEEFIRKRAS